MVVYISWSKLVYGTESSLKYTSLLDTKVNGDWHAESSTNGMLYLFIFYLVDSSTKVSLSKSLSHNLGANFTNNRQSLALS